MTTFSRKLTIPWSWMEGWSIGSIYEMYRAGEKFFKDYRKLKEAVYKEKRELEIIR